MLDSPTINSIALLAIAVIGLYTANKSTTIKRDVSAVRFLSNRAMGVQLRLSVTFVKAIAVLTRRLATQSNEEGDIAAAVAAEVAVKEQEDIYEEHLRKQGEEV